jgi:tetratricopeptide (TPR) repeat protein
MASATPSPPATDRAVLFGLIALQLDFISRDALLHAMETWAADRAVPLGQWLVQRGALTPEIHGLLNSLVDKHVEQHEGDPKKSLARLSRPITLRSELEHVARGHAPVPAEGSAREGRRAWHRSLRSRHWLVGAALLALAILIGMSIVSEHTEALDSRERQARVLAERLELESQAQAGATTQRREIGLQTLTEAANSLSNHLEEQPGMRSYRQQLLMAARAHVRDTKTGASPDPRSILVCLELGDLFLNLGELAEAAMQYEEVKRQARALAQTESPSAEAQHGLCQSYGKLGDVRLRMGDARAARDDYQESLRISGLAPRDMAPTAATTRFLGLTEKGLGDACFELGDGAAAREAYSRAQKTLAALAQAMPTDLRAQRDLGVVWMCLGDVNQEFDDPGAARAAFRECHRVFRRLAEEEPYNPRAQLELAIAWAKRGDLEWQRLRPTAALPLHENAWSLLRRLQLERALPTTPVYARLPQVVEMAVAEGRLAMRAIDDLDLALAQPAPKDKELLAVRAIALASRGRHTEAAATADKLHELGAGKPRHLYNAARAYALCVAVVAPEKPENTAGRQAYRTRAVELLRKAVESGFRGVTLLKNDSDLESLRDDEEFQKLLAEVEAAKAETR